MGTVKLRIMMQPAHWGQAERHALIAKQTMERFDRWYGPYPYKTLTIVDPEPGSQAFGMEYPTLITAGSSWLMPQGLLLPEGVVEHEFGHQYWYGMVATNEFEDAWMDEGINSYTEVEVTGAILGRGKNFIGWPWANLSDAALHYFEYIETPDYDPVTRNAWQFRNAASYGDVTYGKSAV